MLINGNKASVDTNDLLLELELLPSSFPNYKNTQSIAYSIETSQAHASAVSLYNEAYKDFSIQNTKSTIKKLENIEQIFSEDKILLSSANKLMAQSYSQLKQFDKAIEKYQSAAKASFEAKNYFDVENIYKSLANLHRQNNTLDQYKNTLENNLLNSQINNDQQLELDNRLALGAVYQIQKNHDTAIEQYSAAYSLQQGKIDKEAYCIEQHEVGFSNQEKIGTDNIQQCVAVIVYDPESKKTALAHIDRFTDPTSLSKDVIDKLPKDKKLEVYLVGGRDRSPQAVAVSDANIKKVTEILKQYDNIDIKAADVGNKKIPSGIVFDPTIGKLEHAVPGKEDKSNTLRQIKLFLMNTQDNSSKLNYAFDLTKSKDIPMPSLNQVQQKEIIKLWYNQSNNTISSSESWKANQQANPLNKALVEIKKNNQLLVNDVINECNKNKYILPQSTYVSNLKDFFKGIKNKLIEVKDKVINFISSKSNKKMPSTTSEKLENPKTKNIKKPLPEQKIVSVQNTEQQKANNLYQAIRDYHKKSLPIQINSKVTTSNTNNKKKKNVQITRL